MKIQVELFLRRNVSRTFFHLFTRDISMKRLKMWDSRRDKGELIGGREIKSRRRTPCYDMGRHTFFGGDVDDLRRSMHRATWIYCKIDWSMRVQKLDVQQAAEELSNGPSVCSFTERSRFSTTIVHNKMTNSRNCVRESLFRARFQTFCSEYREIISLWKKTKSSTIRRKTAPRVIRVIKILQSEERKEIRGERRKEKWYDKGEAVRDLKLIHGGFTTLVPSLPARTLYLAVRWEKNKNNNKREKRQRQGKREGKRSRKESGRKWRGWLIPPYDGASQKEGLYIKLSDTGS